MSFDRSDLYDAPHVGVVGATGSGKSTLGFHLFEHTPTGKAVFIVNDPNDTPAAGHVVDYEKGGSWDVRLFQEHERVVLVMPPDESQALTVLREIQRDLFALGRQMNHDKPRFYVFVDECHEFADNNADDDNPLIRMAKRGRRYNCRLFMLSQSPADVSKKALKQADYQCVFALGTYEKTYFGTYGMPYDEITEKVGHKDEHRFIVWDDYEVHGPYKLPPGAVN